jgi:hypothetical protein
MKLPNGERAIVSDEKLFGYLLNEQHESQPGHALLFRRLLGISRENGESLRAALLDAAAHSEARAGSPSQFGSKFEVSFEMTGSRGSYRILSIWMIEHGENDPRR